MNKITNGRIAINVGPVAVYLLIAAIGIWFFIFYDRQFGFTFVTAMILMPAASIMATSVAAAEISAGIELSTNIVNKGECLQVTLTVKSGGRLPIPFLCAELENEWLLSEAESRKHVLSVSRTQPGIVKKDYRAEIWGTGTFGIKEIAVHDYLGLYKIAYFKENSILPSATVSIRPSLHESKKNDYLAYICDKMVCDEEEDSQSMTRSFLTQPGYEHRPYVPGDSLKRINWKLSARLDHYMVRENEYLSHPMPVIVLDRCGIRQAVPAEWQRRAVLLEERVVESVLSMLDSMVKQELVCKVHYYLDNSWQMLAVEKHDHVEALRQDFSQYRFVSLSKPRLPDGLTAGSGVIAVFTCALDDALTGEISDISQGGAPVNVICPAAPAQIVGNLWLVNDSFSFISAT